ncbi:MAG TPA: zf-HC2 domain-containing protein [Chloroflexota bacterium]|nr:zf-HC2 domain-containing protein [Chloroflexota bacterium]
MTNFTLHLSGSGGWNTLNTHGGSGIIVNWSRSGGKQCADLAEWISAYADGQTAGADSEAVQAHLNDCAVCQAVLRRHRRTSGLLRLASGDSWNPPDLRLLIAHGIAGDRRQPRRPLWGIGLAACLAFVLLVGVFSFGEISGWNASSPVPAVQQPTVTATVAIASTRGSCSRMSGPALARCLGVSLLLLPTILADQHYQRYQRMAAVRPSKPVIRPPLPLERHSPTPAVLGEVTKGGATRALVNESQHGLRPM